MAWYKHAVRKELPQNRTQDRLRPRSIVLHTAVSAAPSLYEFFKDSPRGVESHFYVDAEGRIEQYIDTGVVAHAQYDGNKYGISIETGDNAASDPDDIGPWNPGQLDALVRLCTWLCEQHDIPAAECPSWDGRGIGYHSQFTRTDDQPGWNRNHACPARARIAQVPLVIAKVAAKTGGSDAAEFCRHRLEHVSLGLVRVAAQVDPHQDPDYRSGGCQDVYTVEHALWKEGLLAKKWVDGHYGTKTLSAYAAWQRRWGYHGADADGVPGKASLRKLARRHGFDVWR